MMALHEIRGSARKCEGNEKTETVRDYQAAFSGLLGAVDKKVIK